MRAQLQYPKLPNGFVEWTKRKGIIQAIVDGKMDIVEALKEWEKERLRFKAKYPLKEFRRGENHE